MSARRTWSAALAVAAGALAALGGGYENRWVFAIDYLNGEVELEQAKSLVVRAQAAGYTGLAIVSGKDYTAWTDEGERNDGSAAYRASRTGLEGVSVMDPARLSRFKRLKAFCDGRKFDFVPLLWSTGYCSMQYADPSFATVWPVRDVPYAVRGGRGRFEAQPVDADLSRMTRTINCFTKGSRRVAAAKFAVKPCRKYRVSARLKTEGALCAPKPGNTGPGMGVTAKSCRSPHYAAACHPQLAATQDWTPVGFTFITGEEDREVEFSTWDRSDREGFVHFADVRVEELGVEYPVFRSGTSFEVRDAETGRTYREGVDYRRPVQAGTLQFAKREPAFELEVLPGGAIRDGARLLVSCYEPKCVYNDQFGACLTNPALYDYYRRSAADMAREIGPSKWFLSADEIRISCRCGLCRADGERMGVRIGRHLRAQYDAIRAASPAADIYMWPDMLDVNHNALPVYYLMDSPTEGALPFVPKDVTMVCWWGSKARIILPHFERRGYRTMGAGYYDADTSEAARKCAGRWIGALNETPGARGIMYTTWDYGIGRNHAFLEDYADVFRAGSAPRAARPAPDLPERPYEFSWANRTRDEREPVAKLESAAGWRVVASNATAKFVTNADRALFGDSVARLEYCASGDAPVIRIAPPAPIPVPDGSDTATLWVYGNNIRGKPQPSVSIAAEFADKSGGLRRLSLGSVWHREWHLLVGVATNGVGGVGRLPDGLSFTGFVVTGGTNRDWAAIDITSLCVFADPRRPDATPPRARRGVQVFREQPQGLNTGEGRLPFPNRPETVVPPPARLSRSLEFRFPKDPLDWSDLAFRYGDSPWVPLAEGGGLFPREAAAGARVTFRKVGNSLVCDVVRPEPGIEEVRFGTIRFPSKPRLVAWPYYTYRHFTKWTNPAVPERYRVGAFYPTTAAAELDGRTLFVAATFDWTQSNASGPISHDFSAGGAVQVNSGVIYLRKTDGSMNGCFERFVWTFAEKAEDAFPAIPNPRSPYMKEAGSGSWTSYRAEDREKDVAYWRAVKKAGMDHVIVTDHETGWRDGNESFTFRTSTAPGKGGDEGQRRYARVMIDELGFRYGPYNNFMDYAPVNAFWSIDHAARYGDGRLVPAWNRCYSPKHTWAVGMCERLAPEIQRKFGFNTAYCDVHTCATPWAREDYDARSPGAATFVQTLYDYCEIMMLQKAAWGGPVWSEGSAHWLYSGCVDGNYAQDPGYDFQRRPWLVDFDLRRMHPLCCNFGMGAPYMFWGKEGASVKSADPRRWMDRFTAATLAFGHSGFFVCNRDPSDLSAEAESYYPVQAIAARYTQAEAVEVLYGDSEGRLHDVSAAIMNGASERSQLRVTYSDGTVVAVNGNEKEDFHVEVGGVRYVLPPNGWRGETADGKVVTFNGYEGGRRVKYAFSPEYRWRSPWRLTGAEGKW